MLTMLSKEFTREEVKALHIAQGMKPAPRSVLAVVKDETRDVYLKL